MCDLVSPPSLELWPARAEGACFCPGVGQEVLHQALPQPTSNMECVWVHPINLSRMGSIWVGLPWGDTWNQQLMLALSYWEPRKAKHMQVASVETRCVGELLLDHLCVVLCGRGAPDMWVFLSTLTEEPGQSGCFSWLCPKPATKAESWLGVHTALGFLRS